MDRGYVWDEDKYESVRDRRDITFGDVVEIFEDPYALEKPDPQGHRGRRMIVGRASRRILRVVYNDRQDAPLIRVITAFEAEEKYRDEYLERRDEA